MFRQSQLLPARLDYSIDAALGWEHIIKIMLKMRYFLGLIAFAVAYQSSAAATFLPRSSVVDQFEVRHDFTLLTIHEAAESTSENEVEKSFEFIDLSYFQLPVFFAKKQSSPNRRSDLVSRLAWARSDLIRFQHTSLSPPYFYFC